VSESANGKEVVAAGHVRLIAYDLDSGAEHWSVTGLPSGCCTSPVIADGVLYFAGWSPGGSDEPDFQMPKFDGLLTRFDTNKDGSLSRDEVEKTFGGFFDSQDQNNDDQISREEYEAVVKFMTEGKNNAFAVTTGGNGDVTASQVLWTQTKGLPYIATAILYRGQLVMVKDGGIVTSYDARSGEQVYMKRSAAGGKYYASPVAANGLIYFTSLEDGTVTVIKGGLKEPEVVAKNPPLGERVAATPAIADDILYIRTAGHLYAFAEAE
jgi:hypothetical protein